MRYSVLLFSILISGCVSTQVISYSDPDFVNYKIRKVAVQGNKTQFSHVLQSKLIEALKKRGVQAVLVNRIAPPTRRYALGEVARRLKAVGYEVILDVRLTDADRQTRYLGTYNTFNAYSFGGSTYGYMSSIPMTQTTAYTKVDARLFEAGTGKNIWIGSFTTQANDALTANIGAMSDNMVQSIIKDLAAKGHLDKGD